MARKVIVEAKEIKGLYPPTNQESRSSLQNFTSTRNIQKTFTYTPFYSINVPLSIHTHGASIIELGIIDRKYKPSSTPKPGNTLCEKHNSNL